MPIRISVFGYGYWGKNVLRTLVSLPDVSIQWACDVSEERTNQIIADYPHLSVTTDFQKAICDPSVDAIVVATPAKSHYPICSQAIELGKHVFVEKPLATSVREATELTKLISAKKVILQVGHIFEYAPAVIKLREWIQTGRLGTLRYITANRTSLGPRLRTDVNIVWDYAIHDVYTLMFLLNSEPCEADADGLCNFYDGIEDTVFIRLKFPDGLVAVLHSSWASPSKRRDVTFVGNEAMVVYDEMNERKLILYKCGYREHQGVDAWGNINWRLFDSGQEVAEVEQSQPLLTELEHFIDCVRTGRQPRSGVRDGLRTIRWLETINQSLRGKERYGSPFRRSKRTVPHLEGRH